MRSSNMSKTNKVLKRDVDDAIREISENEFGRIPATVIDLDEIKHLRAHAGGKPDCARCVDIWLRRAA